MMNQVCLLGRVCNDIELKKTQSDKAYVRFTLAVLRRGRDTGSDFISCVAWDKTAEFVSKYFTKGSAMAVTGKLQTGHYTDKDGKEVYTADVFVEEAAFASSKKEEPQQVTDEQLPF